MKFKIYLASPIFNIEEEESNKWKKIVKLKLKNNFIIIDPIEHFDYKKNKDEQYLIHCDKLNIQRSDIILANCWQPSFGTPMEILYAWERKKPVFIIFPHDNIHPWIKYHSTKIFKNVDDAIISIKEHYLEFLQKQLSSGEI